MTWTMIMLWVGSTIVLCLLGYRLGKLEVLVNALTAKSYGTQQRKAIEAFESMMVRLDELDSQRAKLSKEIEFALGTIENWKRTAEALKCKSKEPPH